MQQKYTELLEKQQSSTQAKGSKSGYWWSQNWYSTDPGELTTQTTFLENELRVELLLTQQRVQVQIVWKHSLGTNKTPATSNKLSSGDSCNNF